MSTDKCTHGWTTPPECPSCMAVELESLRQENARLREALEKIANNRSPGSGGLTAVHLLAHVADEALNPPKRS